MNTRTKKLLIIACGVVIIGVIAAFVVLNSENEQTAGAGPPAAPTPVEVEQVRCGPIQEAVSAVGTITAMHDVVVSSETAGRVTAVLVKVGDRVRAGAPLVLVDDELKKIAVEQAAAQVQAAETNLSKAQKDFERESSLHSTGDVSSVELEAYRLGLRSAEAQQKSAIMALKYAERQLADTRIKAPVSGSVAWRKVDVGEMVAPGTAVANIVDIRTLKVKLTVPEEDIGKIGLKQRAIISVDSHPAEPFVGTVFAVGSKTESPTAHAYPVEVLVQNRPDTPLKAGMFARVDILTSRADSALIVPKSAVVEKEGEFSLFVVQEGISHLRHVRIGIRTGESLQILEGVRNGELVAVFGHLSLQDGSPVLVTPRARTGASGR